MFETCITNLRTALATEAGAPGVDHLTDDELGRRIEEIAADRIRLRPGDVPGHRVDHLLFNLPHLRPAVRSGVMGHVLEHIDLSMQADEACEQGLMDCGGPLETETAPEDDTSVPAQAPVPAAVDRAQTPPGNATGRPETPLRRRPPDLFDRLLDWVAGIVG